MALLEEILSDYLTKWDLQRIARDHDLPVSRAKDEIVGELLALDDLNPAEAVAFMSVWQLRTFCQEHGLPSGAYRETLMDRVLSAIAAESRPRERKLRNISKGGTRPSPSPPSAPQVPQPIDVVVPPPAPPAISVRALPASPTPIEVQVHPAPPPELHVRVYPPQVAAWGFVGVVAAAVFGGIYFVTTAVLGTILGVVVGLIAGMGVGIALLVTENRWAPRINRMVRREHTKPGA